MIVTPTEQMLYTKVRAFLTAIVPAGTEVRQGMPNGVPMPAGGFVCMQLIHGARLSTNRDTYTDPNPLPGGTRARTFSQATQMQLDFYGPLALDNSAMVETLWRDDYACDALAPECQPLYADAAKLAPFVNGEEQYEPRWTLTATLQYNPVVTNPQEFAGALSVELINVDVEYPP